jgi:hypothetical protein
LSLSELAGYSTRSLMNELSKRSEVEIFRKVKGDPLNKDHVIIMVITEKYDE